MADFFVGNYFFKLLQLLCLEVFTIHDTHEKNFREVELGRKFYLFTLYLIPWEILYFQIKNFKDKFFFYIY